MKSFLLKAALAAAVVGGGSFAVATQAQAMPATSPSVIGGASDSIEQVRWVCGPYGCAWRPNYYGYRPYGYRPYRYGGWGYGRRWGYGGGWHRGWRGGYGWRGRRHW